MPRFDQKNRPAEATISDCDGESKIVEQLTVREAGRRGGLAVLNSRGRDFFVKIGRLGQASTRQKYPDRAKCWGKLGGRPKKPNLNNFMEEKGK